MWHENMKFIVTVTAEHIAETIVSVRYLIFFFVRFSVSLSGHFEQARNSLLLRHLSRKPEFFAYSWMFI